MMWAATILTLLALAINANSKPFCPVYGPMFPSPKHMRDNPRTKAAVQELNSYFADALDSHESLNQASYGFEAFSTNEGEIWSRYWTAPSLTTMNTTGVRKMDRNTVHRIGSITKLFTVYTFLATIGDSVSNDPVTKYIPELRAIAEQTKKSSSSLYTPDWDEITVGSLMNFYSGLSRDYSLLGELLEEVGNKTDIYSWGFPPLPQDEIPPCGKNVTCTKQQFLAGVGKQMPYYPSFRTPMYNNIVFTLLAYVAESITGKPFMPMIEDTIIKPLNLTYTFTYPPNDSMGIIPGRRDTTLWANDFGNEAPGGNMYSSVADLSKLGQSILRSTLLKPSMTRRWLKPVSFLPDPASAVDTSYQHVTSYNKAGRVGSYSTFVAVLPDLDMGWSIAASGNAIPDNLTSSLADTVADKFMEVWIDVAREEADNAYSGNYTHPTLNSTMTINTSDDAPGLGITSWLSNGTDMRIFGVAFSTNTTTAEGYAKLQTSVRLYPTGFEDSLPDGGKRISFRLIFEDLNQPKVEKSYATDCTSWIYSSTSYGSKPFDILVFNLDKAGKAVSVESPALRVTLKKST